MKLFLVVAVMSICGSILLLGYAGPHLWSSSGSAAAVEKDGSETAADLYTSKGGDLLVSVGGATPEVYIFSPATGAIGIPNGNQFAFIPWYAFSKDVPVPVVWSTGAKSEKDMSVTIEHGRLTFTTLQGRRVSLDIPGHGSF